MTLQLDSRLFALAKDPENPQAYQDASCIDAEHHIAAVADGVSSALFSGPWAAILAEAVVADSPDPGDPEAFASWLLRQRQRWAASIDTSSLAWFQKAKLPMGAFSTLLYARVCEVQDPCAGAFGGHRLTAFSLGDSCLFQIRGNELVRSFPLENAEQFEVDPIVLGSVDLKRDHLLQFAVLDEMCYPGDELILCTDAVAEWLVRCYSGGEGPVWDDFWKMSNEEWQSGVAWLRQERQMQTDDATMLMLRVVDQHAASGDSLADGKVGTAADETGELGWLKSASKEVKSVSDQMAQQAEQTSERVIQGLRGLGDRFLKKYRDKFGSKRDRSE
jgi:hypothetical protein